MLSAAIALCTYFPAMASALEPLEAFVRSAKSHNVDERQAAHLVDQRKAEASSATGKLLPVLGARGGYTFNQFEAKSSVPRPDGSRSEIIIAPQHQLDAFVTMEVPLVDLSAWSALGQRTAARDAATARLQATSLDVERQVARAFYQVLAQRAVVQAADRTVQTSASNLATMQERKRAGVATDLEVARAQAELERNRQLRATAGYNVGVTERALFTLSGLHADPGGDLPNDELHEEPPLSAFTRDASPHVRAAALEQTAQEKTLASAKLLFVPALSGQLQERFTNATGFANKSEIFTAGLTLQWRLDLALVGQAQAQRAALALSEARTAGAEQAHADDVHNAWSWVSASLSACRAARAEARAAQLAATLAHERYEAGTALHIDVLTAEREAFQSDVARIQSEAELAFARAALRLAAGRSLLEGAPR